MTDIEITDPQDLRDVAARWAKDHRCQRDGGAA